jgi:hypothetical protein
MNINLNIFGKIYGYFEKLLFGFVFGLFGQGEGGRQGNRTDPGSWQGFGCVKAGSRRDSRLTFQAMPYPQSRPRSPRRLFQKVRMSKTVI